MANAMENNKEYGGFLPLELNSGLEYFGKYEQYLLRFNSVKASLAYLITKIGFKKVSIPYYYCPSTTEAIKKLGLEVGFYHIDEELLPVDLNDEEDTIIILVDYFGVKGCDINKYAESIHKAELIIDRAHAFYEEPIIKEHVHTVYSAKKFFGIPDGSYVVSCLCEGEKQDLTYSNQYAGYLLKTYEQGTNVTYQEKKDADVIIASSYKPMSILAHGLLKNVDYDVVYKRRMANYEYLYDRFEMINQLGISKSKAAYQFPLLIREYGREIKKHLVSKKIFVSTLWNGKDLLEHGNVFELSMSKDAVFIPMDQRYTSEDMKYISEAVFGIIDRF